MGVPEKTKAMLLGTYPGLEDLDQVTTARLLQVQQANNMIPYGQLGKLFQEVRDFPTRIRSSSGHKWTANRVSAFLRLHGIYRDTKVAARLSAKSKSQHRQKRLQDSTEDELKLEQVGMVLKMNSSAPAKVALIRTIVK